MHYKQKISIFLLITLCIFLSSILGILFIKEATPQKLLAKLNLIEYENVDYTQRSWNNCIMQLDYDADIVFIGDSLTAGLNPQENFPNKKIVNLGCSGDSVADLLNRYHVISTLQPEKIFIEGGVNSLGSLAINDVASQYEQLLLSIKKDNPNAKLYIQSVLPISNSKETGGLTNENIIKLNNELINLSLKYEVTYIDVYSVYVKDGQINSIYTKDGVHLTDDSKQLWIDLLENYI